MTIMHIAIDFIHHVIHLVLEHSEFMRQREMKKKNNNDEKKNAPAFQKCRIAVLPSLQITTILAAYIRFALAFIRFKLVNPIETILSHN